MKHHIEKLHQLHRDAAISFAMTLVPDRNEADDVVQEVFWKLTCKFPEGLESKYPKSYIWTSIRNLFIERARYEKRRNRAHVPVEEMVRNGLDPESMSDRIDLQLAESCLHPNLKKAIEGLSHQERLVFLSRASMLTDEEEQTLDTMMSKLAKKSSEYRVRSKLKRILKSTAEQEGWIPRRSA